MKKDLPLGLWVEIILFSLVVALLGITPWSHKLIQAMTEPGGTGDYILIARMQPWRDGAWEQAARHALEDDEPLQAIQLLVHARNNYGLSDDASLVLGEAYYRAGDLRQAEQTWGKLTGAAHFTPEAYLRLTDLYWEQHEFEKSADFLLEYYRLQSAQGVIPAGRVLDLGLLMTAVDPPSAMVYLTSAAERSPEYTYISQVITRELNRSMREEQPAYTFVSAGRVLGRLDYWDLAYHALLKAVELRPDYAEAWAYLAEAARQTGQGSGYRQIKKALDLNPDSLAANTYMATYWQRQGNYPRAVDYLKRAARSAPNNLDLQVDLAAAIAASGDLDAALLIYQRAVETGEGTTPFPVGELIQFCIKYNVQVEELALPMARQVVADFPGQAGPFDWHGLVLYTLGDMRNAERAFLRALEQDPRYAPAYLHLGVLYITEGKWKTGRGYLHTALELSDDPQLTLIAQRHLEATP